MNEPMMAERMYELIALLGRVFGILVMLMKTSFEDCGWRTVEVEFVQCEDCALLCYAWIYVVNMAGRYRISRHATE